jgi:hypothetical protein
VQARNQGPCTLANPFAVAIEVLRNMYQEWLRGATALGIFAFGVIGVSLSLFDFKSSSKLDPMQLEWVKGGWGLLAFSGILAGVSILISFVWIDAISRRHVPSLVGKVLIAHWPRSFLRLGLLGWITTSLSLLLLLAGLLCMIRAAWFFLE